MRYSVYDYRKGTYDYYDGMGDAPATGRFRSPVGAPITPESIAARVPPGATRAGSGDVPLGTIATTDAMVGALESEGRLPFPWMTFLAGILVGRWLARRIS
jgi:hypothetical protein